MSKAWPSDRTFVDANRKIVDAWNGPLQQLKPLLALSPQDFVTLQALIAAATQDDGEEADIFDLPIDNDPDLNTDYLISSKNGGRRVPMSLFSPALISVHSFSGSQVDIAVPEGFTDVEIRIKSASLSTTGSVLIDFSEDAGTTLQTYNTRVFNDNASSGAANSTGQALQVADMAAAGLLNAQATLYDYSSDQGKFFRHSGIAAAVAYHGVAFLNATTQPISLIRLTASAGTFDAGTVELWGLP